MCLFVFVCACCCLLKDVQALISTKCCPSCLSFKGWSLHREATQSKRHPPISEILCVRLFLNISILIYIPLVISMYSDEFLSVRAVIRVSIKPVHKTSVWNFQKCKADLCYILIDKQMLENVFCSNIALSLSSGNHLFYKAEYMGQSCPNQVWAITFDWSALAT